ncbi:acyloxyacyl hydrolase [Saccharicrinis sp. GN24d3]|uniref:acyloxyacyl hydrolase n=1 Tax=Saccharicrinis sp. GN24d3 TaxID=3458416 RepID=UPI004035E813
MCSLDVQYRSSNFFRGLRYSLCWFLWFLHLTTASQIKPADKPIFISLGAYYGSFRVHTDKLSAFKGVTPRGVEVEFSRWILTEQARQSFGIFPKWGVGLNYVDFGHADLGYSINGVAYVEPFLKAHGNLRLSGKLGTGFAYLNRPYQAQSNPLNRTYSTNFSFPLVGGISAYYFFTNSWALKANASFRHISNGGIKKPNLGINYTVIGLAIEHTSNTYVMPKASKLNPYEKNKRSEILMGYSWKKDTVNDHKKNVAMLCFNRSFRGGRINAFTLSAMMEYQQNPGTRIAIDQWSIAPLIGNEFLIGDVRFGQQLGVYLLQGATATNNVFQHYYLRYLFRNKFTAGTNLKVHGRVADYLAFQVGIIL